MPVPPMWAASGLADIRAADCGIDPAGSREFASDRGGVVGIVGVFRYALISWLKVVEFIQDQRRFPPLPLFPRPQTGRQNVLISWERLRTRSRRLRGSVGLEEDRLTVPIHGSGIIDPAHDASPAAGKTGHANLYVHDRE
jgi:hypothetical protein